MYYLRFEYNGKVNLKKKNGNEKREAEKYFIKNIISLSDCNSQAHQSDKQTTITYFQYLYVNVFV